MFLNLYRKNLWFHNYFMILQRHRRFDGKDVCNRSIFLPFSPVFFGKSEGALLRFLCFCDFYYCFLMFSSVFYEFSLLNIAIIALVFLYVPMPFCIFTGLSLFIFAIACRLCAYISPTTFTFWYFRRGDRGFAFGAVFVAALFCFLTWRRFQGFDALRVGRNRAVRLFFISELVGFVMLAFS